MIFEVLTLSMQLMSVLSDEEHNRSEFDYDLSRTSTIVAMLFIVFAFLYDIFKWIAFLVSASIETSDLDDSERE